MERKFSWPAVSHIWSLTVLPEGRPTSLEPYLQSNDWYCVPMTTGLNSLYADGRIGVFEEASVGELDRAAG
jgi:hypothetical protein